MQLFGLVGSLTLSAVQVALTGVYHTPIVLGLYPYQACSSNAGALAPPQLCFTMVALLQTWLYYVSCANATMTVRVDSDVVEPCKRATKPC